MNLIVLLAIAGVSSVNAKPTNAYNVPAATYQPMPQVYAQPSYEQESYDVQDVVNIIYKKLQIVCINMLNCMSKCL